MPQIYSFPAKVTTASLALLRKPHGVTIFADASRVSFANKAHLGNINGQRVVISLTSMDHKSSLIHNLYTNQAMTAAIMTIHAAYAWLTLAGAVAVASLAGAGIDKLRRRLALQANTQQRPSADASR